MQQDKNDTENKLRQLENQQLPDLSQMDEHWESIKTSLQSGVTTGSNRNKWLLLTGLLLLIGTSILLFISNKNATKENGSIVKQTNIVAVKIPNLKMPDSVTEPTMPVSKTEKLPVAIKTIKNKNEQIETEKNVVNLPVQLNPKDSTLTAIGPDAQKILNELLTSLAKEAEEFIIDNSRDTILFAAEGSSLYIPAKSLGGSSRVKISLREFYKTSDIVMNKLSTASDGEQLVTGGMVHISATVNDKPVDVFPGKSIKWYLPDTSKQIEQMQLFKGEEKKTGVNWISTRQGFNWSRNYTLVKVLDLRNEPFKTVQRRKGLIGYFSISYKPQLTKEKLKQLYREKYGYYKVRFRKEWRKVKVSSTRLIDGITYNDTPVGDSVWIGKELADKYKLPSTQSIVNPSISYSWARGDEMVSVLKRGSRRPKESRKNGMDSLPDKDIFELGNVSTELEKKYSVDINSLGWINCDRFYNDRREKVDYYVNLQDSAINYYTMMVFNKFRSMMSGYVSGNNVYFANVPVGEPVKIISVGVDKKGEVVMAMKETKINKETFAGLLFESTSATAIKSTLRKEDSDQ